MRMLTFAQRNAKEIIRDPLNLAFGLGFPLVLLFLLTTIDSNLPKEAQLELFDIQRLAPGIAVFGLSFITLFSATVIARDRDSALLQRLYTTPLTPLDFILGYILPVIPIGVAQSAVCYLAAFALGLKPTVHILSSLVFIIPVSTLYIAIGLLCGSVFNDKQVGGICGALLTNLSAWLSGTWFDLELVGGAFRKAANLLPFIHGAQLERNVLQGDYSGIIPHLWWVLGYAAVTMAAAVWLFLRQMKKQ